MDRLLRLFRLAQMRGDHVAEVILVSQIARRLGLTVGQVYRLVAI